ncbi:MAG: hypothetical protein CL607_26590 [Anaerolineaceae bacterium]|nr:hypothetical protein [Anaerolineaceae bacterium]
MSSMLSVELDRNSEEPIYKQLIRQIKMQIESGNLSAGTRLPASRELAKDINVSRISVVNAYAELRAEGYLSAHAGRGTFVSRDGQSVGSVTNGAVAQSSTSRAMHDYSIRDMMKLARRSDIINFSHGSPPPEFFPMQHLQSAINTVLERDGASAMLYERPEGYGPLRSGVRDYVSALGIMCSVDNVLITGGAQQAIDLVLQALVSENETIVTSAPTYIGILDVARARRLQVHSIPMDEDGIRLDCLEYYLMENSPRLIYVMPTFHNPTGKVMPLHRRRQLLNLAHEYDVPVLEDAVYHEFRFEGEPLPPLKALDTTDSVIHVGAFTKMLLPGMRIGYIITSNSQFDRLVRVKQAADISTSGFNQRVIHMMMQRGVIAQQLERNNRELKRRRDTAIEAAKRYFPEGCKWEVPQGGMYLWVTLPKSGPTAAELFITAVQKHVSFAIGNVFYVNGQGSRNIRVNYGLQHPDRIEEGFRYLGDAWRELTEKYNEIENSPLL